MQVFCFTTFGRSFMSKLYIPSNYKSVLSVRDTEKAIVLIKNFFQLALSTELKLTRITAPMFVESGTGLNDDLNGVERPVSFPVKDMKDKKMEIVHSLAKWKRVKLTELGFKPGYGIYTDMNAIRADEELDNVHSLYVDQWDWEAAISASDRNEEYLKKIVCRIYSVLKRTEFYVYDEYQALEPFLPEEIKFIHSRDLYERYPELSPKERENKICKEYGAVFLQGIGYDLGDGRPHDGRAPDYDDWVQETKPGYHGLNGDLLVWNPVLESAFEISSMGIRVSPETLSTQLKIRNCEERKNLSFHKKLLGNQLSLSIGGGIGQSRLCMLLLKKAHIGETQVSIWPVDMYEKCLEAGITLL